jgi:hypothetical protein
MPTSIQDLKKIATILHTIYCRRPHEPQMELYATTDQCKYYLEETIDRTWELNEHRAWLSQALCLISVSRPLDVSEILSDIVKIYQIVERLKQINPKLVNYISTILK